MSTALSVANLQERVGQAHENHYAGLLKEHINGWTFYYDPAEIVMDSSMRRYLGDFRTDDGETVFVVTADDDGIIIY